MRFLRIDPSRQVIEDAYGEEPAHVYPWPKGTDVDHGTVGPGVAIVVYERGLLENKGPFFSIRRQLYAGPAVLYAYNNAGDTVSLSYTWKPDGLMFWPTKGHVELAISVGMIMRPQATVNGEVVWEWR